MTNELTVKDNFDIALHEVKRSQELVHTLLRTPHYAKLGEAGIYAVVEKAKQLGMSPLDALNGALYYVQGRVGMPSETMASIIRQKGHSITKDPKSTDNICILHGKRADNGDTWTSTFSMDDARRAGIAKNTYEKYPNAMLYNRAMGFLARQLFPDVIKNAGYTIEELKEIADSDKQRNAMAKIEETKFEIIEPIKTITDEEAADLYLTLDECDPKFKKAVTDYYKSIGIENLKDLPATGYPQLKGRIDDNHRSYQMTVKAQEIEQEEEQE